MDDTHASSSRGGRRTLRLLLLPESQLEERRRSAAAGGPLAPLFESLARELEPLLGREPMIPAVKALLSRVGGRCERDGSVLEFDPWSPHAHRCATCDAVYAGDFHDRAWVMWYQLWLAERAVHGALFHLLRGDPRHAALARDILRGYAERYERYPNVDNVLGPTRLFFSTYLESIWLLQIAIAADLLAHAGDTATADIARARIIAPSSALIAEYDEGMSNRQVWNNAALLASAALLGDADEVERRVAGPSGVRAHLSRALLSDGTWYEGENYHQFALRGLWYCVVLAENRRIDLGVDLRERFHRAFAAPYVTALPDFTMPSRKDSQYAVSLRQWRMAELAELGFARHASPIIAGALRRTYEEGHDPRDTGRARSTADVERNHAGSRLSRSDLGWRALLHALPTLPSLPEVTPRSALLEDQGYAVFRREGDVYVGFEFGQSGGGHGHPDRLNLTLYQREKRWLDDMGTGSYVDPSLHWFRSTLAHNAPLVDGKSQPFRDGRLVAYDEREGLGWIVAEFLIPEKGVRLERTVVVAPDYLIDELRWTADSDIRVELPWHLPAPTAHNMTPGDLSGSPTPADGFVYTRDARRTVFFGEYVVWPSPDGGAAIALLSEDKAALYRATGPGQPPHAERPFYLMRRQGRRGRMQAIVHWGPHVHPYARPKFFDIEEPGVITVLGGVSERHEHRRTDTGWGITLFAGSARSSIDLSGFRTPPQNQPQVDVPVPARTPVERDSAVIFKLGESHYRRGEVEWHKAGSPSATITVGVRERCLVVSAIVTAGDPYFATTDAVNPYDNEHADTMRAGVQLYVRIGEDLGAWMLVPELNVDHVRVRPIPEWGTLPPPTARWRRKPDGYEMRIEVPLPASTGELPVDLDVIINETTRDRERRRGQLVMSGAHGEFVYLRGDRHDERRLIPFVIVP